MNQNTKSGAACLGFICLAFVASEPASAQGVCDPGAISMAPTTDMIRVGNNTARAYAATTITGQWTAWYLPRVKLTEKLNGSVVNGPTSDEPIVTGTTTADVTFTNVLQTTGVGTYRAESEHWVNSSLCEFYGYTPIHFFFNEQTTINRPARPDYCSGCPRALYYLGKHFGFPIAFDGSYSANAALVAGATNGATGTPQWIIAAGSSIGELSCTNCSIPVFQAIGHSAFCQSYDVVIRTSYDGLESDSFWMFINRPYKEIKANDTVGGVWNYTTAWGNGFTSRINYKTESMCWTDGPMSNYSMNETFSLFSNDMPTVSWGIPSANGWSVPFSQWFDTMEFQCPAANCTPMPLNPGSNTEKVHHADQFFWVGKTSVGSGLKVQKNVHQRYRDEGRHNSIQSPAP